MGMTAEMKNAKKRILAWCKEHELDVQGIRHIHPVSYVVGYAAPLCLIVATPWAHSEPQCRQFDKENPLTLVHTFDKSLKPGDWCSVAYVTTPGCGDRVAVPVE